MAHNIKCTYKIKIAFATVYIILIFALLKEEDCFENMNRAGIHNSIIYQIHY